jgi:hypothetical protein
MKLLINKPIIIMKYKMPFTKFSGSSGEFVGTITILNN